MPLLTRQQLSETLNAIEFKHFNSHPDKEALLEAALSDWEIFSSSSAFEDASDQQKIEKICTRLSNYKNTHNAKDELLQALSAVILVLQIKHLEAPTVTSTEQKGVTPSIVSRIKQHETAFCNLVDLATTWHKAQQEISKADDRLKTNTTFAGLFTLMGLFSGMLYDDDLGKGQKAFFGVFVALIVLAFIYNSTMALKNFCGQPYAEKENAAKTTKTSYEEALGQVKTTVFQTTPTSLEVKVESIELPKVHSAPVDLGLLVRETKDLEGYQQLPDNTDQSIDNDAAKVAAVRSCTLV